MNAYRAIPIVGFAVLVACGGQMDAGPRKADGSPVFASLASTDGQAVRELRRGRLAEARASLERALAGDADAVGALNDLAVTYSVDERFDAARQLLEEVLARGNPREQQLALLNLGELHALEGYLNAAQSFLAAAKAIDPSRPEPSYAAAMLADARGDRATALTAMREAVELDRSGAARAGFVFIYTEEKLHLEALVAAVTGDAATAEARWQELVRGRFPVLAQAAQRHLEEP